MAPLPPPGGAITGAVAGAAVGAAVAHPGSKAEGAVAGAVVGGMIGGAVDAAHARQAAQTPQSGTDRDAERNARYELQSSNYRRAISACLEGRGYAVQ